MNTLAVVSMKGGVGKTTVSVNVAAILAARGRQPVAVIELDPQSGLAWHFNPNAAELDGISHHALADGSLGQGWTDPVSGVRLFAYGQATEPEREAFEALLAGEPAWLGSRIARLRQQHPGLQVVIDTPPGHSVYLAQVLACADQLVMVMLPDMASLATVGEMESLLQPALKQRPGMVNHYLINQLEPGQPLALEVIRVMQERFGPRLLPVRIRRDESVAEALALHQPVSRYDPKSLAGADLQQLAGLLAELAPA